MTQKVNILTGEYWTYGYNVANQMTSAVDKDSGGTTLSSSTYEYDAFGNRVEQDVTISGTTTVQRYAYDGWNPATQGGIGNTKWEVFADLDGSNNLETRYLRGDEVDQHFARIGSTGTAAWLLTDHLGSVVGVTDNSGTLHDTIVYDAFGNITSPSASSWTGRYTWTGREYDATTGLQYNRARYYNPGIGQWTSQDPLGFAAGDSNLYRYATNRPTALTDPNGCDADPNQPPPDVGLTNDYLNWADLKKDDFLRNLEQQILNGNKTLSISDAALLFRGMAKDGIPSSADKAAHVLLAFAKAQKTDIVTIATKTIIGKLAKARLSPGGSLESLLYYSAVKCSRVLTEIDKNIKYLKATGEGASQKRRAAEKFWWISFRLLCRKSTARPTSPAWISNIGCDWSA